MKGQVKIQVFNKDGLLKEEVTKDNLITDAISEILNPSFPEYFYGYFAKPNLYNAYTPLANNTLGGILLFNSFRDASKSHMLPTSEDFVSYIGSAGGSWTSSTTNFTDKVKGSLNTAESGPTEDNNGYKLVWDFGTGSSFTLKSLSLTSRDGGNCGLARDNINDNSTGQILRSYGTGNLDGNSSMAANNYSAYSNIPQFSANTYGDIIYISDDYKTMILGIWENNTYKLTKFTYKDSIGVNDLIKVTTYTDLNDCTNWIKGETVTIVPTSLTLDRAHKLIWDNNYIHSVYTSASGTTLTIHYIKINVSDFSFTEESFDITLANSTNSSEKYYVLMDGKLVINDSYTARLYIIDLSTKSLIREIPYTKPNNNSTIINKINDDIVILIESTSGPTIAPLIDINNGYVFYNKVRGWSNSNLSAPYMRVVRNMYNSPILMCKSHLSSNNSRTIVFNIFTGYLASILNLDGNGISKLEEDTLKITYTITN